MNNCYNRTAYTPYLYWCIQLLPVAPYHHKTLGPLEQTVTHVTALTEVQLWHFLRRAWASSVQRAPEHNVPSLEFKTKPLPSR
jgi:hypothetical protein